MKTYMTKLNEAYRILSAMTVSGSNVDSVAAVRAILREIYSDMGKKETEAVNGETEVAKDE